MDGRVLKGLILFAIMVFAVPALAENQGFTKEDRDRLIRLEATLKVFMEQVDKRLEQMDRRITDLREDMNRRFEEVDKRFEGIDKRFEQVDKRFEQVDKRFEQVDKRFEQVDKRFEQVDKRFEQVARRIERLENVMLWGFGLLFTSMVGLVGFVLWDRRTALAPAIKKNRELEEREELLERALKEYARVEPRLAEILKALKLM